MANRCVLCDERIEENYGKLDGTIIRVKNEHNKREFIYVCSECQKKDKWVEEAKIKGA